VLQGTLKEKLIETGSPNEMFYFSVDGSPVAKRRQVVAREKCNACHYDLSLHGTNRNATEYCVACHNPVQNDRSRRSADLMPAESIDFALMVHRIHSGARQIRDFTVYGFGNTPHNYNKVQLPTPESLSDCSLCHLNGTWNIPLPKTNADKQDVRGLLNPVKPASGACLACHTSTDAAAHALLNTSDRLGESCGVCHGATSDYAVTKVHAR
jgi:OmcA/MtrC family decaheme c-type cytochrome